MSGPEYAEMIADLLERVKNGLGIEIEGIK